MHLRLNDCMAFLDDVQSALAADGGLQRALELTIAELRAESGTIHMMADDGLLHLRAASGLPEVVLNIVRTIPVGKGMAGLAAERKEPITACNIQTDASGNVRPGARATGMEGAIVVPILSGTEAIGTLGVANRSERTFTEEEIEILNSVARAILAQ